MNSGHVRSITCVLFIIFSACSGSRPPLKVYERDGTYYIDVRGEDASVSTVTRLQIREGHDVVWEVKAVGDGAQIGWFEVRQGQNRKGVAKAYFGSYETLVPAVGDTFELRAKTTYHVSVWGTSSVPATASLRIE